MRVYVYVRAFYDSHTGCIFISILAPQSENH